MYPAAEQLYDALIGPPNPERWPESMRDRPVEAQGRYAFQEGLRLGIQLAMESPFPEFELWNRY
ncbi:MAG: hypothetical protein HFF30_01555 [Flavonifractor sp.]|nr:hypothetical protein [Flavonifractor sp.]